MSGPSPQVRRELEAILDRDNTRVGEVHRLTRRGLTPPQIASELGVATSGFVSNARSAGRALLEGHVPSGPSAAQQVLAFVQRVASDRTLSPEASHYLSDRIVALEQAATTQRVRRPREAAGLRRRHSDDKTLRSQVEEEVRRRVRDLVVRIQSETGVEAVDYRAIVVSDRPLDAVVRLVRFRDDGGTFGQMMQRGRPDLTLDKAVVSWALDLPLTTDLVEEAAARVEWFTG